MLKYNPILATDSYKLSHAPLYPTNITGMFSYIAARVSAVNTIVPVGAQMWAKKVLTTQVTYDHLLETKSFCELHGEPFNEAPWVYLIEEYDGYFPVRIRVVPEGTPVPAGSVIATIECLDSRLFWLSSYLETTFQRALWYPTTIASIGYIVKKDIAHLYRVAGADTSLLPFALHDFGARGVSSAESAEIGGFGHLVNFMGSDNVEAVRATNYYYNSMMSAFSVPATEHSIECSYGGSNEGELEYISTVLNTYAKHNSIVAIVIDGYDVYRAAETLCTTFKDRIIKSGAKVVFRPDSGDMMQVVPRILNLQAEAFGFTITSEGYKKINNVGVIQGDGVNPATIKSLLGKIMVMGYSPDNVVFGSGGALLQKVDRDTFKFAQKASAIRLVDGSWVGISKNPITDPGKKSLSGRLTLVRSKMTGEYSNSQIGLFGSEFQDVMVDLWNLGPDVLTNTSIDEIRARANG